MGKNTTVVNKADGSSKELPAGNVYAVDTPSVVKIPVDHDRVKNAAREGDNLVLTLDDGQSIVVENFFKTDAAGNYSDLVLEDDDGGLWWLKWGPEPGAYSFVPAESLDEFLPPIIGEGAGSISTGVAIGAAILAGLGAAAGGGGGGGSNPPPPPPPDTTAPNAPTAAINAEGTVVSGTAEAGSTVTVYGPDGTTVLGTGTAGTNGSYSITLSDPQTNGEDLTVRARDAAGNVSPPTAVEAPDLTAPEAPTAEISDDGTMVSGTAEPGSTVTVYGPDGDGDGQPDVVGTATADPETGEYEITLDPPLTNGEDLTVTATDESGNESDPTALDAPDTTPPNAPTAEVSDDGATVSGTAEPGSTVTITDEAGNELGTAVAGDDGTYEIPLDPPLTNGEEVTAIATDPAGNDSDPTTAVAPDTTDPAAPTAEVNDTGTAVTGVAEPGSTVTVYGPDGTTVLGSEQADPDTGEYSVTLDPALINGEDLTVTATDAAGNESDPTAAEAPDLTVPTLLSAETSADGSSVVLTYDEALDATNPPAVGDFVVTADGTPVAVTGVAVSGNTVTLTLGTPVANGDAVTVSYTDPTAGNDTAATQDLAGNDAASLTATPVTNTVPDTTAPTLVITAADLNLAAGESTTITFQFSEAVTGFAEGDVGLAGGTLSGFTQVDADTWTATFTQTGTDAPSISVADGTFTDVAGNPGTGDTLDGADGFTADTTAPTLLTAETSADGTSIVLTYDEALDAANPPAVGDFVVTADGTPVAVTGVAVSGDTVILTLATPVANGDVVAVSYTDPTAGNDAAATQDLAGNDAASFTATPVTNTVPDTTAPTLIITAADLNLAAGESTTVTFQFSEAVNGFAIGDVGLAGGVLSGFTQVDADTWTATFTQIGTDAPSISVADGAFTDVAGNPGTGDTLDGADGFTADTTPPTLLSAATSTDGGSLVLTYDEALDPANLPVAGDFTVMVNGAEVTVSAVTVSGTNVTLTLATPVANGDAITVSYTDPTAGNDADATQDLAGNDAASFADNVVTNTVADTTAPTLLSAATSADGSSVVLTYDEALDAANPPAVGDFVVTADGTPVAVTGVTVSGNTVTLTLSTPVANGDVVAVSYTDPTAGNDAAATQDMAGNDAASFTDTPVTNTVLDTTPPTFVSAETNTDGSNLLLTYDEALDPANPPAAGDFVVTVNGTPVAVADVTVSVSGDTVILTLVTPVANGDAVTVSYTDPTAGNDANATQDLAGNDADDLAETVVTNNVLVTPDTTPPVLLGIATSTDGSSLVLTYDETLDAASPPAVGDFVVTADGTPVAVTGVAVSGNTVTLTLGTPVANGDAVTVSYTDPTAGDDTAATQDVAGNDAASFTATPVTNTVPDTTAPTLLSAATSADGGSVVLTYDEVLDAANPPAVGDFVVTADGTPVAVTGVTVSGNTVTLTLGTPMANGDVVAVSYTDPTAGNDAAATQDLAGNDAASFTDTPVTNIVPDTTAPTLLSAATSADGGSVVLTYDEALDAANPPAVGDFVVTADGTPVAVTGVTVSGNTVTLTLATPVAGGDAVAVSYTDPTAGNDAAATQDLAGNDAASFTATPATNIVLTAVNNTEIAMVDVTTASAAVDEGSATTLLGLGVSVLGLDLQAEVLGVEAVSFDIPEGHAEDLVFTFSSLLDLSLLGDYRIVVQKFDEGTGQWTTIDGLSPGASVLTIGLLDDGSYGVQQLLDAGQYRAFVSYEGVGLSVLNTLSVTGTDYAYTYADDPVSGSGNVITDVEFSDDVPPSGTADQNVMATTVVDQVNGVTLVAGDNTFIGAWGTLVINRETGAYNYTPDTTDGSSIGQVDTFTYTLLDTVSGATSTATLTVSIGSGDVAADDTATAGVVFANVVDDAYFTEADGALIGLGSQTYTSATFQIADNMDVSGSVTITALLAALSSGTLELQMETAPGSGTWVTVASDTYSIVADLGVIASIDLSALTLDAGNYRVQATKTGLASVTFTVSTDVNVTYTDQYVVDSIDDTSGNLLANDAYDSAVATDGSLWVDDGTGTFVEVTSTVTVDGDFGTLVVNANGSYTYTPDSTLVAPFDTATDVFTYQRVLSNGQVDTATLTVTVDGSGAGVVPAMMAGPEPMLLLAADSTDSTIYVLDANDSVLALGDGSAGSPADTGYAILPSQDDELVQQLLQPTLSAA